MPLPGSFDAAIQASPGHHGCPRGQAALEDLVPADDPPPLQFSLSEGINYNATNAYLNVNGGTSGTPGGNVRLYGSAHSGQGSDIEFRTGSTVRLLYDFSVTRWDFAANAIYDTSDE